LPSELLFFYYLSMFILSNMFNYSVGGVCEAL